MNDEVTISLGTVWEEAFAFVRTEFSLLTPLALLGFALPMVVLELVMPKDVTINGQLVIGPWLLWLMPHGVLSMLGTLSITALALNPGMSVREALAKAFARLPAGICLVLFAFVALLVMAIPVSIVGAIEMQAMGKIGPFSLVAYLFALGTMISFVIRLLPIWTVLAGSGIAPWAAVRQAYGLTRGHYPKLLMLRILSWTCQVIAVFVLLMPIAVLFGLLGNALGAVREMQLLSLLVSSAVIAAIVTIWTVYVARLTTRLSGSSSGI